MKYPLTCILILIIIQQSYSTFELFLFNNTETNGAVCLDGSPAGLYIENGNGNDQNNYIIFLEGGGACLGLDKTQILYSCYQRSKTKLGTSTLWSKQIEGSGILSNQLSKNPNFYMWTKIFVPYCDGTVHQGFVKDPFIFENHKLYFRGYNNTKTSFQYIIQNQNLSQAQKVLLTGSSAGGIASFAWSNVLKSMLPSTTQLWSAPDSGFFIDFYANGGAFIQAMRAITDLIVQDPSTLVPSGTFTFIYIKYLTAFQLINTIGCPYRFNKLESYKCLLPYYFARVITVPQFIIESEYDSWQLENNLQLSCLKDKSFQNCNQKQMEEVNSFRSQLMSNISSVMQPNPSWGTWEIACVQHGFLDRAITFNVSEYEVPEMSNDTVNYALYQWITNQTNQYNQHFIDQQPWPSNQPCSGLNSSAYSIQQKLIDLFD